MQKSCPLCGEQTIEIHRPDGLHIGWVCAPCQRKFVRELTLFERWSWVIPFLTVAAYIVAMSTVAQSSGLLGAAVTVCLMLGLGFRVPSMRRS